MKKTKILSAAALAGMLAAGCTQESTSSAQPQSKAPSSESARIPAQNDAAQAKILVAYFSATNTTKQTAQQIEQDLDAENYQADLYEIVPEIPYTGEDLNYSDSQSRTSVEMNDPSVRPALAGEPLNLDEYAVIFLGYPIWWGEAPRIIDTFLESYDFSGKTVIPFCTSGGSGIEASESALEELSPAARWMAGRRFGGSRSSQAVEEWVDSLNLEDVMESAENSR